MSINQPLEQLNERELEIIPLIAEGLTNSEIASRLFLAKNTVKWYIRQLNSKLDTSNRDELIERANELGLMNQEKSEPSYLRPRHNLPHQTTPFIGRDAELDEIHRILENPDVRLLTILAPGGMGKTRIALEATEQQSNHYPDGVYFINLQALSTESSIIPQIASTTGFQFSSDGRPQEAQILDFLSDKQILLCMDNWEHLLDGVPLVSKILQSAPGVRIISTSRERLGLMTETIYSLPGMQFPDWQTPADALEYDAVQLLIQSAQRVKPGWELTDNNLDDVSRICKLTQGMPLGILLATSWLDMLPLNEIADEIEKNVDFLETDLRDIPERQQSIRAIFDYAWSHLSQSEQQIFMQLSVLRGAFSREAAQEITGANLRQLQSLLNKALIQVDKSGRYDLHELLRVYAGEKLEESGDADNVRTAHLHYFVEYTKDRDLALLDDRQVQAMKDLKIDYENIRTALYYAGEIQDVDSFVSLRMDIGTFQTFNCLNDEMKALQTELIVPLANAIPEARTGMMVNRLRLFATFGTISDQEEWHRHIQPYLEVAQELHDVRLLQMVHRTLARYHYFRHPQDLDSMLKHLNIALEYARQHEIYVYELGTLAQLARYYAAIGDYHQAIEISRVTRHQYEKHGNAWGVSGSLSGLAIFHENLGDIDSANKYRQKALEIERKSGRIYSAFSIKAYIAESSFFQGDFQTVQQILDELEQTAIARNSDAIYGYLPGLMMSVVDEDYEKALHSIKPNYEWMIERKSSVRKAPAHFAYAITACGLEDDDTAEYHHRSALKMFPEADRTRSISFTIHAVTLYRRGDYDQATQFLSLANSLPDIVSGWIFKWSVMRQVQDALIHQLGEEDFDTAWEQEKVLDADTVVEHLLENFEP